MEEFDKYCKSEHIISSFFRLHPFLSEYQIKSLKNIRNERKIIVLPLDSQLDTITKAFKHGTRKSLRKAREFDVKVKSYSKIPIDQFYEIYNETMDRNNASPFYYFDKLFFSRLNQLSNCHKTYIAFLNGKPISVEVVLYSKNYWHSFLGGTLVKEIKKCPNILLKYSIIKDAIQNGALYFILGGGHRSNDGVFNYKKSFSPDGELPFNIQCNIHLEKEYKRLINNWESYSNNRKGESQIFQRYLT